MPPPIASLATRQLLYLDGYADPLDPLSLAAALNVPDERVLEVLEFQLSLRLIEPTSSLHSAFRITSEGTALASQLRRAPSKSPIMGFAPWKSAVPASPLS